MQNHVHDAIETRHPFRSLRRGAVCSLRLHMYGARYVIIMMPKNCCSSLTFVGTVRSFMARTFDGSGLTLSLKMFPKNGTSICLIWNLSLLNTRAFFALFSVACEDYDHVQPRRCHIQ